MTVLRRENGWHTAKGYNLTLTDDERDSLAWIADRYTSASVLYDCARWEQDDETGDWTGFLSEGAMWGYVAALHALEDYDAPPPPFPPCAGGALAEKLTALVESFPTDMTFRGIDR